MKVFLGGTCIGKNWREEIIPRLTIDYFNPLVEDWTPECQEIERREKVTSDILLYVITPQMKGTFSIAEAVDDSNRKPHKTVFCILETYDNETFGEAERKSLEAVADIIRGNKGTVLYSLDEVVRVLNTHKKVASMNLEKYYPVFLDTEFTDLKQDCKLISIGLTDVQGNTYYAETDAYKPKDCSPWVRENILPTLKYNEVGISMKQVDTHFSCKGNMRQVRESLMEWFKLISGGKQILVVSDCLAYDWVLFVELVRNIKDEFPSDEIFYVPVDIMGLLIARGLDIDITREDLVNMTDEHKHNSLHDAKVIREIWVNYL